jgi:nitroreductase
MLNTHQEITKAIIKSQHCQRNWDLTREIPQEDYRLLMTAATQCPSKQNIAHYRVHAVTNRDIIERIHENTKGFSLDFNPDHATTNSQVLANLLIVLEKNPVDITDPYDQYRTDQTLEMAQGKLSDTSKAILMRDCHMAVGIAAGYLNVVASMLGYSLVAVLVSKVNQFKKFSELKTKLY